MGRKRALTVGVVAGALVLAACSSGTESAEVEPVGNAVTSSGEGGWDCPSGDCDWSGREESGVYAERGEALAADEAEGLAPGAGAATPSEPAPTTTVGPGGLGGEAELAPVTAGSVDDNELWDEYLRYRATAAGLGLNVRDIPVEGRQVLRVVDPDGNPVLGARVVVTDQRGTVAADLRTYADGRTLFFPSTDVDPSSQSRPRYTATATIGGASAEAELTAEQRDYELALDAAPAPGTAKLDVHFLIDATGSMSDEIDRLKAHIDAVAEEIDALPVRPDLRFGMTVYRDRGDLFVTRTFDFTADATAFAEALDEVQADGGGDTPEDLEAGLAAALGASWRGDDTVKLLFLVADAPPHLDYPDSAGYADSLTDATARGIKIHPIAASGLDPSGEYVFRQLGQITTGRFVFLTYGADGVSPGESTPHNVEPDDYSVLSLDQLVVRLVTEELDHLQR